MLGTKKLIELLERDLQALLDSGVAESKMIEYKSELPGSNDEQKKEFLFDVSSFANASGGHLIYGIIEETGIPTQMNGLTVTDEDAELRRLQSLILDGIKPRMSGLEMQFVHLSNSKPVLVIHVPKSWLLPHMVVFKGTDKFYSRSGSRKHRLDVDELRSLFTLSSTITEKVKHFRIERLSQIIAGETPIPMPSEPKIVLHLIPLESFSSPPQIDLAAAARHGSNLLPFGSSGYNNRVNLDGLLHHTMNSGSYIQLYKNGIIETVNSDIISANGNIKSIPSGTFNRALVQHVPDYMSALEKLGVNLPIVILLTLIGVKGYSMAVNRPTFGGAKIDRDILLIPEIILDKFEIISDDLQPLVKSVWNAAGWLEPA